MTTWLIAVSALISFVWVAGCIVSYLNFRTLERLKDQSATSAAVKTWPKVSVLVPARDEEEGLEAACQSLLAMDYPNLEVLLINDRSEDRTAEIMTKMAARD